jgi:drug/metabolite transporter (DMT)-like permease
MNWLIVTILSYFFLALVSLFDRYLLIGPIQNPYSYTFFVGILWFFIVPFLAFFGINFGGIEDFSLGIFAGLIRIFAILFLAKSIIESEISRVIPAIGGLVPIFTFLLFLFLTRARFQSSLEILAFFLLLSGSILISSKKFSFRSFNFKKLKNPLICAFLFAFNFFLTKILFKKLNFFSGFFLILIGGGIGALLFLFSSKVRREILTQKPISKTSGLFVLGQIFGGLGVLLQFYALFLAKSHQVPLINALAGTRHVFLLALVSLFSIWNPKILREEVKGKILYQKVLAIILIGIGLAILALK